MNDLCVILAMTAVVGSGLGAGDAGADELHSERVILADPIRAPEHAADRATGSIILYSQYVRKPFMWPWASSPAQSSPSGEIQRGHGNRGGGSGGGSGNSGSSGGTSGSGNMGGGSGTGNTSGGNMGGSNSGGSGSGNMK